MTEVIVSSWKWTESPQAPLHSLETFSKELATALVAYQGAVLEVTRTPLKHFQCIEFSVTCPTTQAGRLDALWHTLWPHASVRRLTRGTKEGGLKPEPLPGLPVRTSTVNTAGGVRPVSLPRPLLPPTLLRPAGERQQGEGKTNSMSLPQASPLGGAQKPVFTPLPSGVLAGMPPFQDALKKAWPAVGAPLMAALSAFPVVTQVAVFERAGRHVGAWYFGRVCKAQRVPLDVLWGTRVPQLLGELLTATPHPWGWLCNPLQLVETLPADMRTRDLKQSHEPMCAFLRGLITGLLSGAHPFAAAEATQVLATPDSQGLGDVILHTSDTRLGAQVTAAREEEQKKKDGEMLALRIGRPPSV